MKKLVAMMLGTSLAFGALVGSASGADLLGVKKRAEKRENSKHDTAKQLIEGSHKGDAGRIRRSEALDGKEKMAAHDANDKRRKDNHAAEAKRHGDKLSDIRSRNALGMKKRGAAKAKGPAKAKAPAKKAKAPARPAKGPKKAPARPAKGPKAL